MPPLEFFAPWLLLLFVAASILVPGFLIWLGLRAIGKKRGIVRCGLANFAAFAITSLVSFFLHFTPLVFLVPLVAFVTYLYVLKSLLDISFFEAFLATIVALAICFVFALIVLAAFGIWFLFAPPRVEFGLKF